MNDNQEVPYEVATSTELSLLLSNGSPPSQGFHVRRDPFPPDSVGRPSLGNRARIAARVKTAEILQSRRPAVNGRVRYPSGPGQARVTRTRIR